MPDNKDDLERKNYAYFSNTACEYFPCHKTEDESNFNCLFCYCPMYHLGEKCGGSFTLLADGRKDCSSCMLPHRRENYELIIKNIR